MAKRIRIGGTACSLFQPSESINVALDPRR
jgi:hypothetical protein